MINIDSITRKDGKIYVSVSLTLYSHSHFRNHISCDTAALQSLLKEKKVAHGKCVQEKYLLNRREKTCSGTWIFEEIKKTHPEAPKKSTQSRRSKKREKTLDKSSEDVIIDSRDKTFEE